MPLEGLTKKKSQRLGGNAGGGACVVENRDLLKQGGDKVGGRIWKP